MATPARAATWASTSLPRSVPAPSRRPTGRPRGTVWMAEAQAGAGVRRERVAAEPVHVAHAVRRQLLVRAPSETSPTTTASTGTPPPAADRLRAKVMASSETSTAAPSRSVSTRTRIIGQHPQLLEEVDDGGRGAAPSPRICTLLGAGGGSSSLTRWGRAGSADGVAPRSRPSWPASGRGRWVARLDAALEDRDDGGQRDPVGLVAVGTVAARGRDAVGDGDRRDAVDDRPAQLVGEPDADLEVAAVGGVVAEQHQVVRAPGALVVASPRRRSRGRRRPGRTSAASATTWVAAVQPDGQRARSCSAASASPRVITVASPPSPAIWTASSTAHSSWGAS